MVNCGLPAEHVVGRAVWLEVLAHGFPDEPGQRPGCHCPTLAYLREGRCADAASRVGAS